MINNPYIIDFNPIFLIKSPSNKTVQNTEEIIQLAIFNTFKSLSNIIDNDIKKHPLVNRCDLVRNKLGEILEQLRINIVYIETQEILGNDVVGHSILIVTDEENNKNYLIDPTYSQFFLKDKCSQSNYLIKNEIVLLAPDPGYYYLSNPDKMNFAKSLLKNGYFELNEETAKIYFDSFYKTRRGRSAYIDLFIQDTEINGKLYLKLLNNAVEKKKNTIKL